MNIKNLISIQDLSKTQILNILKLSFDIKNKNLPSTKFKNKILASCFFEPSTRTRLSFETAMIKLGGNIIGFSNSNSTSASKQESLTDSIKIISSYADIIILRHPEIGAAKIASQVSSVPIINAGDGSGEHPTQTLLDLFSIFITQQKLENLNIIISGDLYYSRTVHSLVKSLINFKNKLYLVSQPNLGLPSNLISLLKNYNYEFEICDSLEPIINQADILYTTRIQKERLKSSIKFDTSLTITPELISHTKNNFKILHPLPRNQELDKNLDNLPCAYYFAQAKNGIYIRQALLSLILY